MRFVEATTNPLIVVGSRGPGKFDLTANFYRLDEFMRMFAEQEGIDVPVTVNTWRELLILVDTFNGTGELSLNIDWEHEDIEGDDWVVGLAAEDAVVEIVAGEWMTTNVYSGWTSVGEHFGDGAIDEDSIAAAKRRFDASGYWLLLDNYPRHPNELLVSTATNYGRAGPGTEQHLFVDTRMMHP